MSGVKGDTFVLSGWAVGHSVPLGTKQGNHRRFGLVLNFVSGGIVKETYEVNFEPSIDGWQYASTVVKAENAFDSIKVQLAYDYNANAAWFDGIGLFKEEFGTSYEYDEKGNLTKVTDLQKNDTTYEFDANNNLIQTTLPGGAKLTYDYDQWGNVTKATTELGQVYEFAYDQWGNNTTVSLVHEGTKITTTASYTSNGNFLLSSRDAAGYLTRYGYNEQTGVLNWVQYPEDTADTRTEYTYDNLFRMATASATTDTGLELNASYTYTEDLLTKIQTPTTEYTFQYGNFALRSTVKAGDKTLASYAYTTDGRNLLSAMTYGNGDSVSYTYDQWGRVTQDTYNDGETVEYQYDNSGALATVTDSESGIKATYYYDLIDRLCKYEEAGQDYSFIMEYGFNERNQVSYAFETINGNKRSIGITYDKDGRVTSYRKGGVTEAYTYDKFGRLTNKATTVEIDEEVETRLTETLTYRTNSSGNATGQVNTMSINAPSGYHIYFTYGYDMNGNIAFVKSGDKTTSYTYDSAGQLIREDNQAQGKSWTWVYDNAGNILSKKEYAYTTGTLGTATDTVSYVYDTGSWGDLLTSFDGQAITYDGIGNPTRIGNRTFTWKHGRELATLTENGTTWTNTYNADGLRISRTNGTLTYKYYYSGGQLVRIAIGNKYIDLSYDASGQPMSLYYSGYQVTAGNYYYVTNLQGDVVAILDDNGTAVVTYTYDAWGNILSVGGTMADTLGVYNPLRYRGYVYDEETSLYYLQSRYYDPNMGRFLNADVYVATGQGFVGNNTFAYCGNNPINYIDPTGQFFLLDDLAVWAVVAVVAVVTVVVLHPTTVSFVADGLNQIITDVTQCIQETVDWVADTIDARTKGKERIRDSGLANESDEEITRKAHDKNLPPAERNRYKREEKGRGFRNKQKRLDLYK